MINWFIKDAPIKRKLTVAFGVMSAAFATATAVAAWEATKMKAAADAGDPAAMAELLRAGGELTFIVCLVSLLASIVLAYIFNKIISTPYMGTVVRMEALAAGDLESPINYTDYKDCVGRLTRAMQTFKQAVADRARGETEAAEQRRLTEEERARNERERQEAERLQRLVVDSIAQGLSKLSDGDLTFRLNEAFPGEYKKLQDDFNAAMGHLQDTMGVIVSNASGIKSGAGEISHAADDLSKRTEQQAATLEETAAALDEITATVKKTAQGATQANTVVGAARTDAEKSGQVVREAVAAMSQIEQSAQKISQIIGVIDEIAFQTNLLALNAGVEAARAGDAGKGFAVVASEVRALAQRSAEAAKEIKALISASTQQVESGVDLVGQTGVALERIVDKVGEISGLVSEIAASAQEQATGLSQVNTAVNQMDQSTQQNAAMVEQSTAASHSLAHEAEELSRLVARFEIGARAVRTDVARRPAPRPAGVAKPAIPPAARFAAAQMRTPSRDGSALRKPQPTVEEDGWEEF